MKLYFKMAVKTVILCTPTGHSVENCLA